MPLRYLGKIGQELPQLTETQWKKIFEFIEFFMITNSILEKEEYEQDFNWAKIKEILLLLDKVKRDDE